MAGDLAGPDGGQAALGGGGRRERASRRRDTPSKRCEAAHISLLYRTRPGPAVGRAGQCARPWIARPAGAHGMAHAARKRKGAGAGKALFLFLSLAVRSSSS